MTMHRIALAVPIAVGVLAVGVGGVSAQPGLTDVPPHRHFLTTENGEVEVGPRVCDSPGLQSAFNQFHHNIHIGTPTASAFAHEHNMVGLRGGAC